MEGCPIHAIHASRYHEFGMSLSHTSPSAITLGIYIEVPCTDGNVDITHVEVADWQAHGYDHIGRLLRIDTPRIVPHA